MKTLQDKLVTVCKDCVFAKYDENTQVGCYARNMDPYEFYEQTDGNLTYRIIHRQCQFYRNDYWNSHLDLTGKLYQVNQEILVKYTVFIDGCAGDIDDLKLTVESINNQILVPQSMIVVYYDGKGLEGFNLLRSQENCCHWIVEEFLEDRVDWRDDILLKFRRGAQLFAFLEAGTEVTPDYFLNLSNRINYQDLRFEALSSDGLLIIPYGIYFIVYKDQPLRFLLEKAQILDESSSTKYGR